jgi:hypothetical protein
MRLLAVTTLAVAALMGAPALAASPVVGTWTTAADTQMGKLTGTLTVAEAAGAYTVTMADDPMPAPAAGAGGPPPGAGAGGPAMAPQWKISDVKVDGNKLSFKRSADMGGQPFELTYAVTVDGDKFAGEAASSFGPAPFTGTRKK